MQIGCVEIQNNKKNTPGIIYEKDNGFCLKEKKK